jgi:hypothetical protein
MILHSPATQSLLNMKLLLTNAIIKYNKFLLNIKVQ